MSHIFISYSRKDIDFAQKIVGALAANNLDTWIDWKSIPKGEDWEQEIYRGIETADAFLFLISPDSVVSEMCNKEVVRAIHNRKRILPIFVASVDNRDVYAVTEKFLGDEQKKEINRRNFIFCRERDHFEEAIQDIEKTIRTDYAWLKYHTELQVKSLQWEQNKDLSRLLRGKELREAEQQLAQIDSQEDPQPTKLQREYILASQRNEIRTRRQITLGLSTGLLIMIVLSLVAWGQRNVATAQRALAQAASTQAIAQEAIAKTNEAEAKRQAKIASSRQYAALASLYVDDRYDLSALFSVEAVQIDDTQEAQTILQKGVKDHSNIRYLPGPIHQVVVMSFGQSEELLATAHCDGGDDTSGQNCQESNIQVWEIPSREQIGLPISVPGTVYRLLISRDGKNLIAGVCHTLQDSSFCTQEVWVWSISSPDTTHAPLLVGEEYPLQMDINDNNVLAIASCRQRQETEFSFRCSESEITFFDLTAGQFAFKPLPFEEMLGPLAFTDNDSLAMSRCTTMNETGSGCFGSEIQVVDIHTAAIIRGPHSLGIDYPVDMLPGNFHEIYIGVCHESEDLGRCAQPQVLGWDLDSDESGTYWSPDITPVSLSMSDYRDVVVLSSNAIQYLEPDEGKIKLLLDLPSDTYSGMTFLPSHEMAAVFRKDGAIQLIDIGFNDLFGELTFGEEASKQDLIKGACEIAGRNFTQAEWQEYFSGEPYHITCPQWPAGE